MARARVRLVGSAGLLLLFALAHAAGAGFIVEEVDPSARGAAMGSLGVAALREPATASWRNPALLGYQRGVGYAWSELDFGISDFSVDSHRMTFGGFGLGVALAGWPIDALGGTGYSLQLHTVYEPGEIDRYEEDRNSVALGANILEIASHLIPDRSARLARAARLADLSAGAAVHRVRSNRLLNDGETVQSTDAGIALRVSPIGKAGLSARGLSLDAAAGYAWHCLGDTDYEYGDEFTRTLWLISSRHYGGSLRLALDLPAGWADRLRAGRLPWLAEALSPLLALEAGRERTERTSHDWPGGVYNDDPVTHLARKEGWEVSLAGVIAVRGGEVENGYGWPLGSTKGWGISLPLAGYGRLSYDRASQEYGTDLRLEQTLQSLTLSLDAQRIWRRLHTRP